MQSLKISVFLASILKTEAFKNASEASLIYNEVFKELFRECFFS